MYKRILLKYMENEDIVNHNLGESLRVRHGEISKESITLLLVSVFLMLVFSGMSLGFGYVVGLKVGEIRTEQAIQAGEPYMNIDHNDEESCIRMWVTYGEKTLFWNGCIPMDGGIALE